MQARLALLFFLAVPLCAQTWEAVRGLAPPVQVRVKSIDGLSFQGRFESASDDAISITTKKGAESVERKRVRRVEVRSASRRARRLAIAAGIGLAMGVVIDQTLGTIFRNETGEATEARAATYAAPTAIFGGIAGAFPAYRTVYRTR